MPVSRRRPTPGWNVLESTLIGADSPPETTSKPASGLEKSLLDITEHPELAAAIATDTSIKSLRDVAIKFEPSKHGDLGPRLLVTEPSASTEWVLRRQQLDSFDAMRQTAGVELLASSPAFNIATDRIEALPGVNDDTRDMLESIQRIQNVSTDPQSVPHLLNANFTSAAQIAALPLDTFAASVPNMPAPTAQQIHSNATAVTQRNEMALAAVAPGLRDDAAALAVNGATPLVSESVNLDSLFSNAVATKCNDCCSVLSPSAYLVDLLEFLATSNGADPRRKLFDRRPDIGQIELSCANTNTEIPYIDLVNEALESYLVSQHGGLKPEIRAINNKEDGDSAQLIAEPQNVDFEAYEPLKDEVSPLGALPFERDLEQTRILLEKLGTSRQELLEVFATETSEFLTNTVTAEVLKIPSVEYTAMCKRPLNPEQQWSPSAVRPNHVYWGFDSQAEMLNDYTGISRVKTQFLPKTGYTYDDLVELLQTKFVNGSVPKVLTKIRDSAENSLDNLWQKVHWNKVGVGRAAQWGDLLSFLGIQDIDSEAAADVMEAFPKLPNLCVLMPVTTKPESMPPFNTPSWDPTRRWPMTGFVDFISGGQVNPNSNVFAVINEYGHLLSKTTRQPLGYFDSSGILRQSNTETPYYSLPEFPSPGYFAVRYAENGPIVAKLLRDVQNPGVNGEMMVVPGDEAHMAAYFAKKGPREVAEVAGWSWQPREALGEPDLNLLAVRTLSGQPLSAERWRQINAFVRLQKRMGWTISETDQVCTAFGAATITAGLLEELSLVKTLQALTRTTLSQAIVFARNMPEALYRKLFLKPSVLVDNSDFALGERGTPLFASSTSGTELQKRHSVLASTFNATPADIVRVLAASGTGTSRLSLASLSSVYRHILLCRSLGLPLSQLSSLLTVFGGDPFKDVRTTIDCFTQWRTLLDRYSVTPSHWEYFATGEDQSGQLKPTALAVIQTALAVKKLQVGGAQKGSTGDGTLIIAALSAAFGAIPPDIMTLLYQELSFSNDAPTGTSSWYFIPPATGEYTLHLPTPDGGTAAAHIEGKESTPEDVVSLDNPVNLVGGQAYRVRPSNPASLVMMFTSKATITSTTNAAATIPEESVLSHEDFQTTERIMTMLSRYELFFSASNLSPDEYEYLLNTGRLPPAGERLPWAQIVSLVRRSELRDACRSAKALAALLGNSTFASAASAASAVSAITAWELPMTQALISHFAKAAGGPVALSVELLDKIRVAYGVAKKLGLPDPAQLLSWASPLADLGNAAAELRAIARSKVDEETWEATAAALFDPLRRASRDALVAACLRVLPGLRDANGLFEFFLIDVGMGTCLRTSRLKQAISSIQIYVQRCLLGLEVDNGVLPSHIDAKVWEWMQSYETWRANRTVILYPENWLEPSLRDSRSETFKALEATMAQGKLTSQELVAAYVSGMAEVADLEPVAVCDGPKKDHETMQIDIPTVNATRSIQKSPDYWMKFTYKVTVGWSKADLDAYLRDNPSTPLCSGSYLQAAVLDDNDDHLILFIPTLSEKNYTMEGKNKEVFTKYYWEVSMGFSERKDGKWTAKQQCPETVTTKNVRNASDADDNLRPWPPLPDPDLDDHLVRQGSFFFVPTTDSRGTQALWAYLLVPVITPPKVEVAFPTPKLTGMKPHLKAAFFGEFSYERGQLNVRRTRPGARFDKLLEIGDFPHDWLFQGKTETTGTERTRRIFDHLDVGKLATMPLVTVDVTSLEEQPVPTEKNGELAVPLSNNFVDKLQDLVSRGRYKEIFNHFGFVSGVTWPLFSSNYPGSAPAGNRTDSTTVLYQSLGIQDRAKPNTWYHELHTPIAIYNWELYIHLPILLANNFLTLQQFDKAIKAIKLAVWRFLPFRETAKNKNPLGTALITGYDQAEISRTPFNLYAVTLAKGDSYFRRFTLKAISLAIQCYVKAAHVYGPPLQSIISVSKREAQTFRGILDTGLAWALDDGQERALALWELPLDPGALIRAAASGSALRSVVDTISGSMPNYRFRYLVKNALEVCENVKKLGVSILKLRRCKDVEQLRLLTLKHQRMMVERMRDLHLAELDEAKKAMVVTVGNCDATVLKMEYYLKLLGKDGYAAMVISAAAGGMEGTAAILHIIPQPKTEMAPMGTGLYYSAYNLALDLVAKAERVYRFKRGLRTSDFIRSSYWNSSYNGLLLRASASTGDFELPETLWDMDFPGHYHWRIKSVRVSIKCGAGPNASLNTTLTLLKHRYHVDPAVSEDYAKVKGGSNLRFTTQDIVPILSVAVYTGHRKAGVFNLNFLDERYMPFKGAGVISEAAETSMSRSLAIVVDPCAEYTAAWRTFSKSGTLTIPGPALRLNLPFYARGSTVNVRRLKLIVGNTKVDFTLTTDAGTDNKDKDKGKGAVGEARSGLGAWGGSYKIGADEKLVDDLGVRWEAKGKGDRYKD
ncbi:hypothetical protein B0T14DRAFT_493976 [Immersiella caudata]|uniref:Uncharacterized protein n=1 Tax=Immersiella caudata TaxID=314043 RepID=A0AA39X631_9PEZI|nr:hypothetical protein B0T14DRAFT_493976 [Immersiella caudata]